MFWILYALLFFSILYVYSCHCIVWQNKRRVVNVTRVNESILQVYGYNCACMTECHSVCSVCFVFDQVV